MLFIFQRFRSEVTIGIKSGNCLILNDVEIRKPNGATKLQSRIHSSFIGAHEGILMLKGSINYSTFLVIDVTQSRKVWPNNTRYRKKKGMNEL
jgi:hypothetical protein